MRSSGTGAPAVESEPHYADTHEAHADRGTVQSRPSIDGRLLLYLHDVATHPFSAALDRDDRLGLSQYQGVDARRRLVAGGMVEAHGVSTGRRSGRIRLLRLTPSGAARLRTEGYYAETIALADFLRGFHLHQLARFARDLWPGSSVSADTAEHSAGNRGAVNVLVPGDGGAPNRTIAFRLTGNRSVDAGAVAADLQRFDEVYVWSETWADAKAIERGIRQRLPAPTAARVTCMPITTSVSREAASPAQTDAERKPRRQQTKPTSVLLRQIVQAYADLHDLDRLDESPLVRLEVVRESVNRLNPMAEARAVRALLLEAARRAALQASDVPTQQPLRHFLEQYVAGKNVTEIAAELGVSREWCSRSYRKQALELAAMQCERLIKVGAATVAAEA